MQVFEIIYKLQTSKCALAMQLDSFNRFYKDKSGIIGLNVLFQIS